MTEPTPEGVGPIPSTGWWGAVLEAPDPKALCDFYTRLLGWDVATVEDDWCTLKAPNPDVYLGIHASAEFVRPTWPPADGQQQAMGHLDFEVTDVEAAVAVAIAHGATLAPFQPQDDVRVMLDPIGHPFCLYAND
jgi:catechol 2,3-dioxygenase-like lactoylglutathione lyase family enzyme